MKKFFRTSGLVALFLAGWTIVLAQTGSKTPIRNGILQSNIDFAGFKGVNSAAPTAPGDLATKAYVDANGGTGPGGGGGLISITGDDGTATGLSLTITGNTDPLTDPVFTLGGTLSVSHGGTGSGTSGGARINLGLGNVNDTSDLNKPISTATQTALNLKVTGADVTSALAAFVGSANLITLGTITTGTWHADPIGAAYLPSLDALSAPSGDVSLGSQKATNMGAPVASTDGANKGYVDSVAAGGVPHPAAATSSTGNLTLSGEQTIDGVLTSTSRILVKNQSSASENGIYVTAAGGWSRASDANSGTELAGSVFVTGGTAGAGRTWALTTPQPIVIDVDAVAYTQTAAVATYTANGGITLTSNNFALSNMAANSVKGNNTGSPAAPLDLNMTQLKTLAGLNNVENTTLSTWAGSGNLTTLGTIASGTVPLARVSGINTVGGNFLTSLAATTNATWVKISPTTGALIQRTNSEVLGDIGGEKALTFSPPFIRTGDTLTMAVASSSQAGALSLTDWSTFNNKVSTGRKVTSAAPLTGGGDFTADRQIGINVATAIQDGYMRKEEFVTFSAKTPPDSIVTFNNNGTTGSPATWTPGATAAREINPITVTDKFSVLPPASGYAPGKRIVYTDGKTGGAFGRWFRPNGTDLLNGATGDFRAFMAGSLGPFGSKSVEFEDIDGTQWQVVTTASTLFHVEDPGDPLKIVGISAALQPSGTPGTITAGVGATVTVRPETVTAGDVVVGVDTDGSLIPGTVSGLLPSTAGKNTGDSLQVQSDGTADWSAPSGGSSSFQTLDGTVEPIVWTCIPGKTTQNAYVLLGGTPSGSHSVTVVGANSGYSFHLIAKQDSTGGRTIAALPTNSAVEGAGTGVPTLTGTANAVDELFGDYSGIGGVEWMWRVATNFTKTVIAACNTLGAQGGVGSGNNTAQNATTKVLIANGFVATATEICRAELTLLRTNNAAYDMKVYVCPDAIARTYTAASTLNTSNIVVLGGTGIVSAEVVGQSITGTNIPAGSYIGSLDTTTDPANYRVTLVNARTGGSAVGASGTATGTATVNIFGFPGTPINAAGSDSVNAVAVTTTAPGAAYSFTNMGVTGLTIGAFYHLVLGSQAAFNTANVWTGTDYVTWVGTTATANTIMLRRNGNLNFTGPWSILVTNKKANWKTYGP